MTDQVFDQMRRAMVSSQLRTTGVNDPRVVAAMGVVPRELFVPDDRASLAYLDIAIPLGEGRSLNAPMITGRLLTQAQIDPGTKVLLIGAATGYAAALLVELGAQVVAVEEDAALIARARAAGLSGVEWIEAPLTAGYAAGGPYALVVIDGAVAEIPAAIVEQLAEGGRLVAALVEKGVTRLVSGVRAGRGFGTRSFADADAVVLPGFERPAAFSF